VSRSLKAFKSGDYEPGATRAKIGIWYLIFQPIVESRAVPQFLRISILRVFGANISQGTKIRRGIKVHFPWRMEIGKNSWIGEEVWFINHEKISIGNNVCISQRAIICSGGHDYRSASLAYQHAPINIGDGVWVCLDAKVLPGTRIGKGSVIAAGEVARGDIPDFHILIGGKLKAIDPPTLP
jgi:putative colanic acid biosynthesis acetyltransferase WcaF